MIKNIILITMTSTLILGGCGNKLNKKTAQKVLLEAQEPVVNTKTVNSEIYEDGMDDQIKMIQFYTKAKILKGMETIEGRDKWRIIVANQKKIDKKWADLIETHPKTSGRNPYWVISNYTTRVGDILRIDTKPVDRLCDALVEYKYEAFDYAPWGKDVAAMNNAGKTVYEACFIKYDKSWGVKDWRKKPGRRRR